MSEVILPGLLSEGRLQERQDPNKPNVFTKKPNPPGYQQIHETRMQLPVSRQRAQLLAQLDGRQVIFFESPTGSGKSTQVTQIVAHWLHEGCNDPTSPVHRPRLIPVLTQPHRVGAMECASRLALEMGLGVGQGVGLQTKGETRRSNSDVVLVVTDDLLLEWIKADRMLPDIGALLIDDIHERSVTMDLLMGFVIKMLPRRPAFKLLLMSATGEMSVLQQPFQAFDSHLIRLEDAPSELHRYYLEDVEIAWDATAANLIRRIVLDRGRTLEAGDILCFCPGEGEIAQLQNLLDALFQQHPTETCDIEILPLFRDQAKDEQQKALQRRFAYYQDGEQNWRQRRLRKIILATPIAETSSSFPDLSWVLECGETERREYVADQDAFALFKVPCSKAQIVQRIGRAGRAQNGRAIHLYTRGAFDALPAYSDPPILREDLTPVVLDLRIAGEDIRSFPWTTAPTLEQLVRATDNLYMLGFLHPGTLDVSDDGKLAARLRVDPRLGKMILEARGSGVEDDVLVLVAIIKVGDIRKFSGDERERATTRYFAFSHESGDHLSLVNLYKNWRLHRQAGMDAAFARQNCLNWTMCLAVEARHSELRAAWDEMKFPTIHTAPLAARAYDDWSRRMLKVIVRSLKHTLSVCLDVPSTNPEDPAPTKVWRKVREMDDSWNGIDLFKNDGSMLGARCPRYVVFQRLDLDVATNRLSMTICTAVEKDMLSEIDPAWRQRVGERPGV